jgi:hypothetical protein
LSYQTSYILQQGIPEYDGSTNYFLNSVCQNGGSLYQAIGNNFIGQIPNGVTAYWTPLLVQNITSGSNGTLTALTNPAGVTFSGPVAASSTSTGLARFKGNSTTLVVANNGTGSVALLGLNSVGIFIIEDGNNGQWAFVVAGYSNITTILSQSGTAFATTNTSGKIGLTLVSTTGVLSINNQTGSSDNFNITALTNT